MITTRKEATDIIKAIKEQFKPYDRSTRADYYAWMDQWKAHYKELTRLIQELRGARKQFQWKRREVTGAQPTTKSMVKIGPNPNHFPDATYVQKAFSGFATEMLEWRSWAKQKGIEDKESQKA